MKLKLLPVAILCGFSLGAFAEPQTTARGMSVIVVKTMDEASAIREQIQAGESFDSLAMKHSVGSSAADGGYVGEVRLEELRPEMQKELAHLRPSEVSAVTTTGEYFLLLRWSPPEEDRWRAVHNSGMQALQHMRYPDAVRFLSEAIQQARQLGTEDSRLARSLHGLSQTHALVKQYSGAEPLARQALTIWERLLGPRHVALLPGLENLATVVMAQKKYDEAEHLYRRVLSLRWGGPEVWEADSNFLEDFAALLSAGFFEDARFDKTYREFERALERSTHRRELYLAMGVNLLNARLVKEARRVLQRASEEYPTSYDVQLVLAEAEMNAGDFEKSLGTLKVAVQLEAQEPAGQKQRSDLYHTIGRVNVSLFRYDDALTAYTTALTIDPGNAASHLGAAHVYLLRGKIDTALSHYALATSSPTESAEAYLGLAEVKLQLGRFSESAADATTALKLDPKDQSSRYVLAMALNRAGHPAGRRTLEEYQTLEAEAAVAAARQQQLDDLSRSAHDHLAQGRLAEAIIQFRKAIDAHPDSSGATRLRMKIGLLESRLGRHQSAVAAFQGLIERRFDNFLVHRSLAEEYRYLKDPRALQQQAIYFRDYDAALRTGLH